MKAATATQSVEHAGGTLVMKRVFHAPRTLVFDAWTRPEHFSQWFGPAGASMPHCRIDLRVGGELHFFLRVPGDIDTWCRGVFRDVRRPGRIVFTAGFSDASGNTVERPGFPIETVIDVFFVEYAGSTEVTVRQQGLVVDQGEIQGWTESFDRLDVLLEIIS